MITEGLRVVSTHYIILWMDDYLLYDNVSNDDIERYLEKLRKYDAVNIRLYKTSMIKLRYG